MAVLCSWLQKRRRSLGGTTCTRWLRRSADSSGSSVWWVSLTTPNEAVCTVLKGVKLDLAVLGLEKMGDFKGLEFYFPKLSPWP